MNLKRVLYAFLALIVIGCSSDDMGSNQENQDPTAADFVVIGEDLDKVYQFNYDAASESGQTFDLSQDLGIGTNYLTLREIDDFLSFYTFAGGSFSLAQKDVFTGATANFDNFYSNVPERSLAWGTNTFTNVIFGYFTDSRNLAVLDLELNGLTSTDYIVDFGLEFLFQPLIHEDRIFITYRDNQGNYKVTFFNTLTKSVGSILNFNTVPISILISGEGNLVVVKNGIDPTLEIYDSSTLTFINSTTLDLSSSFSTGPLDGAVFSDNKLHYAMPYTQPSRFVSGPAIYDALTHENFVVDLIGIVEEVEQDFDDSIGITVQTYSDLQNVFLVGYGLLGNEVKGGVLQISPEGELLANIELPFFPSYFVKD